MTSILKSSVIILFFAIAFSACKKRNDAGKMIPQNALFVAYLDTKSLDEKLSWEEIKQTSWYKDLYSDTATKAWIKNILDNPENSGIDSKGGLIFFVTKGTGNDYDLVFEGKLKDAKAFEQFNKNIDPSAVVSKDGGVALLVLKDHGIVGWQESHFVYITNSNTFRKNLPAAFDSLGNLSNIAPAGSEDIATSVSVCKKLFTMDADSTLSSNKKFSALMSEKGDIHGWINSEEIMRNNAALGMLGMLKLDVFFKGNISTYSVNFENGRILVNQKNYAGKEFTDFLKKYKGDKLNIDMINNIPSQNIVGLLSMNFSPEGFKELIKLAGMDGFINMYAGQMGFYLEDFTQANSGNLLLAITDLSIGAKPGKLNPEDPDKDAGLKMAPTMKFLFATGIGNKPSFQKLVDAGKKIGPGMGIDSKVAFNMNDKFFVLGNDQSYVNSFIAGGKHDFAFTDQLKGHPIGIFVDLKKILTVMNTDSLIKDPGLKSVMNENQKLWNNAYFTGGEMDGDALVGTTEI
ncbi:MAG: DUF4836 family protein, partial [Ginsengibacter sp.]